MNGFNAGFSDQTVRRWIKTLSTKTSILLLEVMRTVKMVDLAHWPSYEWTVLLAITFEHLSMRME